MKSLKRFVSTIITVSILQISYHNQKDIIIYTYVYVYIYIYIYISYVLIIIVV